MEKNRFKILLIRPNISLRYGYTFTLNRVPPLSLAYLAAALRDAGYPVEILDMVIESDKWYPHTETHQYYGVSNEELIAAINDYQPDLIGIGSITCQHARVIEIVQAIKANNPSHYVVLGGVNATSRPRRVLETTGADFVLQGEAEETLVALADVLRTSALGSLESIDGIAFRQNGDIVVKSKNHFIGDVDGIAWPAYELLKNSQYASADMPMPIITSRSCPKRCTFCSVHMTNGKAWRPRDPDNVVKEMHHIVSELGYHTVAVFDDACNIDPKRLNAILRTICERKLDVRLIFPGGLVLSSLTEENLYWLKEAGTVSFSLPLEHVNEYIRNTVMNKKLALAKCLQVLDWCRKLKILSIMYFVIGMPGETEETIQEIEAFIKEHAHKIDAVLVSIATPFPGTSLYQNAVANGWLRDPEKNHFMDYDCYTAHMETDTMSKDRVAAHRKRLEKLFLDCRGKDFPATKIREIIRRPTPAARAYLDNEYFKD